tara:strand:- start:2973 stop:3431 length:459 start_codon:yes stop_codon:yes gene_type:complete
MSFEPTLTPKQIFEYGAFGGTYFRPIYSSITKKNYKNQHKKFKFLSHIDDSKLIQSTYDKSINKYKVKVGTSLEFWEDKKWITSNDPYGWIQWYCNYYQGRRIPDEDERQIKRWLGIKNRFGKWLINLKKKNKDSPKIKQTLLHWGINPDKL